MASPPQPPFSIRAAAPEIASNLALLLLLAYFGVVFHGLIFFTQGVNERDGFYHARFAQMLPERGISRAFPWMQFTYWKSAFCDKDFLYHVFLAPFCTDAREPLPGAKIGTLVLALGSLAALFAVLKKFRAPWPLFWVALLASGSALLVNRMMMVRSHDLSILLMIVAAGAILARKPWACFTAAFIYPWCYSFPVAMLLTALGAETGRALLLTTGPAPERKHWRDLDALRIPLIVLAGLAAGLVFHPYFPNSLTSLWMLFHITFSAAVGGQLELGSEFLPLGALDVFTLSPGLTAALFFAIGLAVLLRMGALDGRRLSPESAGALSAALLWFCGMFVFSRMIEYAGPLSVLAAALSARDAFGAPSPPQSFAQTQPASRVKLLLLAAVLTAGLAASHAWTMELVRTYLVSRRSFYQSDDDFIRGRYFEGASKWIRENVPPKTVILNFHWDDFPELYYSAPENYYIVGLDPTIMQYSHPEKALELERMRTGKTEIDFAKLKALFGTDYMILRKYRAANYEFLKSGKVHPVFSDAEAVIYRL